MSKQAAAMLYAVITVQAIVIVLLLYRGQATSRQAMHEPARVNGSIAKPDKPVSPSPSEENPIPLQEDMHGGPMTMPVGEARILGKSGVQARRADIHENSSPKVGRPPKKDYDPLLNAESWDDFYRMCKEENMTGEFLEDLILKRLAREFQIDDRQLRQLSSLYKDELEGGTQAVIDYCGGAAGFQNKLKELRTSRDSVLEDFRRSREEYRRTRDMEYLQMLNYTQLQMLNEHLRSSMVSIDVMPDVKGTNYYMITGAGLTPR